MAINFLNNGVFASSATATSFISSTDSGININGLTMTRVAANSAIRVSDGLETLGLLRSYAGLNVATTGTFGGNITLTKAIGDSVLTIEADTDNDNENDNPRIELKQDGGAVYSYYGINGDLNNTFTGALVNHTYLRASTGLQLVTNGSSTALTLDTSQNATFAGGITTAATININNPASDKKISFDRTGGKSMSIEHDTSSMYFYNETDAVTMFKMFNAGSATVTGDFTVNGGDIILGGTGRIQGVDTVSAGTDAANKAYVDAHDGGAGVYLPLTGGILTGNVRWNDAKAALFGSGQDMHIYHYLGQNYIDTYNGNLILTSHATDADILFKSDNGSGGS